jgi:hypothetical protein
VFAIVAPPTPVRTDYEDIRRSAYRQVEPDLTLRRVEALYLFFGELPQHADRAGAIDQEFGLLRELAHAFEVLEHGFLNVPPIHRVAIDGVVMDIILKMVEPEPPMKVREINRILSEWDYLEYLVDNAKDQHEALDGVTEPFFRHEADMKREPFSPHHFVLIWLLRNGIVIDGIEAAAATDGYDDVKLFLAQDAVQNEPDRLTRCLLELEHFHKRELGVDDVDSETFDGRVADARRARDDTELAHLLTMRALIMEMRAAISACNSALMVDGDGDLMVAEAICHDAVIEAAHASLSAMSFPTADDYHQYQTDRLNRNLDTSSFQQVAPAPSPAEVLPSAPPGQFAVLRCRQCNEVYQPQASPHDPRCPELLCSRCVVTHVIREDGQPVSREAVPASRVSERRAVAASVAAPCRPNQSEHEFTANLAAPQNQQSPFVGQQQRFVGNHIGAAGAYPPPQSTMGGMSQYQPPAGRPSVQVRPGHHGPGFMTGGAHSYQSGYMHQHQQHGQPHLVQQRTMMPTPSQQQYYGGDMSYISGNHQGTQNYDASVAQAAASLPNFLQQAHRQQKSVQYKIDPKLLDRLKLFDGSHDPVSLRDSVESVREVAVMIPKGDQDKSLQSYLMFSCLEGRALECAKVENARLRSLDQTELQQRADLAEAIIVLMYRSFPKEDTNLYMLELMRFVRVHWRDANAPDENLREFMQRFMAHMTAAKAYYHESAQAPCTSCGRPHVEFMTELSTRMLFVAALPVEIQTYITTQRVVRYDDPALTPAQLDQLYAMCNDEYDLREKRGEKLTKQASYGRYPNNVLTHREADVLDLDMADTTQAGGQGGRVRGSQKGNKQEEAVKLYKSLRAMSDRQMCDKLIKIRGEPGKQIPKLMKVLNTLKFHDGRGSDTRSYASLAKLDDKDVAMFHMLLVVLFNDGTETGAGRRVFNTKSRSPSLVQDDDGKDLYEKAGQSIAALVQIPRKDWRGKPALELQKNHYLKIDGKLEPACFVCGAAGHVAGCCLQHLSLLKATGEISTVPSVASTEYNYGTVIDVCVADDMPASMVSERRADSASVTAPCLPNQSACDGSPVTTGSTEPGNSLDCDWKSSELSAFEGASAAEACDDPGCEQPPHENVIQYCDIPDLMAMLDEYPRMIVTFYMGPKGLPVRVLFDTGSAGDWMLESVAVSLGLKITKAPNPVQIRQAMGQVSPEVLDKCVRDTHYSALNGEVSGRQDMFRLLPSMPPMVDVIAGRPFIFGELRGQLKDDCVACYTYQPPDSDSGAKVPIEEGLWKVLPFTSGPAIPSIAAMELCNISVPITGAGDGIDELCIVDGDAFDKEKMLVMAEYVEQAKLVLPKNRSRKQRQMIAAYKAAQEDTGPDISHGPVPPTGPKEDVMNSQGADLPAWLQVGLPELPPAPVHGTGGKRRVLPRQHKAFTAVAAAVAALVLLLTATTGHAQPSDVASISVAEPVQWEWPIDGQESEVPWRDSLWDDIDQPRASADELWKPTPDCIDVWYTELGFQDTTTTANDTMPDTPPVSAKELNLGTTAGDTMAEMTGASEKHAAAEAGDTSSPPITRAKWFPTLRYEAIVKPAGPATLRTRLNKEHGYEATLAQVRLALDVIRPEAVDSGDIHAPPPEGNTVHTAGRLPDSEIDTPWPHKAEYAAATRGNVGRFTCLGPIEKFEPPAHHKRLKFELKEGIQMPRMRNPRPTPVGLVQQLGDFCKGLKSQGRIVNSTSPIASPVLIIPKPKKNPTDPPRYRFVIDYRSVNTTLVPHSYRLPTCDSLWYTLDNATYISTADAADGYWLAPLDPETAWLTAFDTPEGRHEWTCLPMGIQPASGWYQSFMEDLLARNNLLYTGEGNRRRNPDTGRWENFVIAYQDDLIWWSDTEEDHHEMTELFLDTFSREKLYLNPNKLNLCCKHTRYLGCIVGNGSLSMDPRKVDAVMAMSTPVDVTGVRQLLGMCQFYRRWIPAFSSITAPLTDMLKKGVDFATTWGKQQDDAVAKLKTAMSTYPVLRQFDPTKPVILLADASTTGLGGCLAQHHDGVLYPVSYSSHRLTAAERRYPITELEGLAILHLVRSHGS